MTSCSILVGGFSRELQTLSWRDSKLETTKVASPDAQFTWIVSHPSLPHIYYALDGCVDKDGSIHVLKYQDDKFESLQTVSSGGNEVGLLGFSQSDIPSDKVMNSYVMDPSALIYNTSLLPIIAIVPLDTNGLVKTQDISIISFEGSGPVAARQEAAHPHGAFYHTPTSSFLVTDLGSDLIRVVRDGALQNSVIEAKPGEGPRHLALHSNGTVMYAINELTNTIAVYKLELSTDTDESTITHATYMSSYSMLPLGSTGAGMTAAAILLSPDNRFLYASNRNEEHPDGDAIVFFQISQDGLVLTRCGEQRTGFHLLRAATLLCGGKYLITGSNDECGVVLYAVDQSNGNLTEVARNNTVELPSCFVEMQS